MPFNTNQFFYAATWLTDCLSSDVPESKRLVFLRTLRNDLESQAYATQTTGGQTHFIAIGRISAVTTQYPVFPFDKYTEHALEKSGIDRKFLMGKAPFYLHDDGQILVPELLDNKRGAVKSLPYPRQPDLPYTLVNVFEEDMAHCPQFIWQTDYRVVPLREGQPVKWVYPDVYGKRVEYDEIAQKDDVAVVTISGLATGTLNDPSDDDIIMGAGNVIQNRICQREEFTPGYDRLWGLFIQATGQPSIVREISAPFPVMDVREPVQIHLGHAFSTAAVGDKLIIESKDSAPRVIRKKWLDDRHVVFVPSTSVTL